MGGCATKPKVYKSEGTNEAPAPAPEPTKEEKAVGYAPYSKDKEVLLVSESENKPGETDYFETEKKDHKFEGGEFDQLIKEVVDVEDKSTDEQTKRRSLSNLFKENEQGNEEKAPKPVKASTENEKTPSETVKDSTENEKGPSEPVKAEALELVKPKEGFGNGVTVLEAKTSETQVEPTPTQEFVGAPKEPLPENLIEAVPAETLQSETKSTEEVNENTGENAKPVSERRTLELMEESSVENVKPVYEEKSSELKGKPVENVEPVSEEKYSALENSLENVKPVSEVKTLELKEKTSENDEVVVLSEEKAMELKESAEMKDKM